MEIRLPSKTEANEVASAENKHEAVYAAIKTAMLRGEYPEGSIMAERKLCEKFGVSRSPVREALKRFVREGLMDFTTGNRIMIPYITIEEIIDVYDVLELVEPYIARRFMNNATQEQLDDMRRCLERMRQAIEEKDFETLVWGDLEFHNSMVHGSSMKRMRSEIAAMGAQRIRIMSALSSGDVRRAELSADQHERIYEAIVARDEEALDKTIREHIASVRSSYIEMFARREHNKR